MVKPVVLCILDGWGIGPDPKVSAPAMAHVPNFNRIWATCPHATLTTFGPDVGLPRGQMGNSEVGHTNIGAGRVVAMDLGAIDLDVENGDFAKNHSLQSFIATLKQSKGTAHLMGVVSNGGVHGHIVHLLADVKDDGAVEFNALMRPAFMRPSSLVRYQLKVHGCPLF